MGDQPLRSLRHPKALRLVPPRSIDQRNPERKGPESINSRQSFNIFHTLTITDVPHNEWNNYKRCMQGWCPSSFSFSDKPCNASGEWFSLETGEQWPVKSSQALRCTFSASAAVRSWQDPLTCPPNASSESCRPHLQHLRHLVKPWHVKPSKSSKMQLHSAMVHTAHRRTAHLPLQSPPRPRRWCPRPFWEVHPCPRQRPSETWETDGGNWLRMWKLNLWEWSGGDPVGEGHFPTQACCSQNVSRQTSLTSIDLAKASPFTQALVVRHVNHLSMRKLNQRSIEY